MVSTATTTLDWTHATLKHFPGRETEVGDLTVSAPEAWIIAAGEYADEGEPDLIVSVTHAVDSDGNDVSGLIAGVIRDALTAFATGKK